MFDDYLKTVVSGDYLSAEEAYTTARMLLHDNVSDVKAAAFLSALRTRKESVDELSGFVQAIYEQAVTIDSDQELLDTCGTGGDGLGTFNISTGAALVAASCGVRVAKHGNRAVTGKVGSADVLEGLGVNIQLSPDQARDMLDKVGITFLFAPFYHPILKQVGRLRRDMGVATIFNFLGPLLNPCPLSYQIMGIADSGLQEAIAQTMIKLGRKRALVIHAENGMDEVSPFCKTTVCKVEGQELSAEEIHPSALGIKPCSMQTIRGGYKHQRPDNKLGFGRS
jgi:anthranilate phosphoribosyltransferase